MAPHVQLMKGMEPYPGYRLDQLLGQGGWGQVWRAQRLADGAFFALKFLTSDSQFTASQEIRALQAIRQLDHPNLVKIDQVWSCSNYLVIVMEQAEGSLLDLLDIYFAEFKTAIMPDHLCYFLSQAADAIDFLNTRHHIVNGQRVAFRHCDIKPSNLLVFGKTVKVADYSLAAQTTSPMWYHRRVGTLDYAAPEIFQGWLSERTDQYALAVTYYQLRTGKFPFYDTPSSFRRDYFRPHPDLLRVTPEESSVLQRALAAVPQDRWPSCVDMMERLTRAINAPKPVLQPA